jgi:hypothetical protein
MTGDSLLARMDPQLGEEEFVFCSVPRPQLADLAPHAICVFEEDEGVTLILERAKAERLGLSFAFPCRRITLRVHSSLDAVGFLAKILTRLAEHGVPVNCVSAYYHDHLFVPVSDAERTLVLLQELQQSALLVLPGVPSGVPS